LDTEDSVLVDRYTTVTSGVIMRWSRERFWRWWLFSRLVHWAPAVIALIVFGLVRLGFAAAVVDRGGWPTSWLGWSGAISSAVAAGQAFALAALLPAIRRRRPMLARVIAAAGIGTAVVHAALWVALGGSAEAAGYAWQLVLALAFAVAAMVLCRSGIGSIWTAAGYDLPRISRSLLWVVGFSIASAIAGGAAALVVEQSAVDRLLRLIAVAGLASAVSATVVLIIVAQERWRAMREAQVAELYRQIPGDGDSIDR
jgi:hypothetical protein